MEQCFNCKAEAENQIEGYCDDCNRGHSREGVHEYGYTPDLVFKTGSHNMTKYDNNIKKYLFLSPELEIETDGACMDEIANSYESHGWFTEDSSLNDGAEFKIFPATLKHQLDRGLWEKFTSDCKSEGFKSHDTTTCGLHIHINKSYLGDGKKEVVTAKILLICERIWDELCIFSRRKGNFNYCPKNPKLDIKNMKEQKESRSAINCGNSQTLEFRIFKGTLKANTIYATLELVSGIVEYAKSHNVVDCNRISWKKLSTYINNHKTIESKHFNQYCNERGL